MYYRWNKKTTMEETKRIDIRYMKNRGLLKPFKTGSLNWSVGGEPSGDIRYTCHHDYLQLNYRYRENGEEWQPVEEKVFFDRTPCNYGGERLWFLCPRCGRRVVVLSGYGARFLCRHCYGLSYGSQNEGALDRLVGQKHKLGARIFEHYEYGEGWGKRKGMHWKTFHRLNARYEALERRWCAVIGQSLGML
jgi:hypothetical protein